MRRGSVEVLRKKQRLKDVAGSVGQLYVTTFCENSAGLLMKDGRDCGYVPEGVGKSDLFACGIGGKRVNAGQK
ncbi:MAG TPA: hypothetical protein VK638_40930 [Edaphobacter sp.]|nr:hypothetical protein [Edaphobacter sp.]